MIDLEEKPLFVFDLQHHSELEGGDAEGESVIDSPGETIETHEEPGVHEEQHDDPLALPSKFGLKDGRLEYISEESKAANPDANGAAETDDNKANPPEDKTNNEPPADGANKPSFYTPAELNAIAAQGIQQLDPTRIPPEALPFYKELIKVSAQQTASTEQKAPPKAEPVDVEKEISSIAMAAVAEELKKNGEEFDEYNFAHQQKYFRAVNRLERDLDRMIESQQRQQSERQSVMTTIQKELDTYRTQDKDDFVGVDQVAATLWQQMPYEKAWPVAEAMERLRQGQSTQADIPVLKSYWEESRREYFAKKTGVSKEPKQIPPQQLKPSNGQGEEKSERFDAKKLQGMNQDQRIEYYKRTGLADKIGRL